MPNNGSTHLSLALTAISNEKSEQNNPLISDEKLRQLYAAMLESRVMAERSRQKRRAVSDAREACEVGCTIDLRSTDTIAALPFQSIRHRGAKSTLGGDSVANRRETVLRADVPSAINLVQSGDSGGHLALSTGVAFAYAAQRSTNVVVAFVDAKRIKQAHDSMAFAVEERLPVIYVELAERSGNSRNSATRNDKNPQRIATMPVDQSDVVAIYRVACEAIEKARRGAGPSLIQCIRYKPHSAGKRSTGLHSTDPIAYMEEYLRKKNLWSPDFKRSIEQTIRALRKTTHTP